MNIYAVLQSCERSEPLVTPCARVCDSCHKLLPDEDRQPSLVTSDKHVTQHAVAVELVAPELRRTSWWQRHADAVVTLETVDSDTGLIDDM